MPQETNLNVAPYFDDFDPSDSTKNYCKILFKPGLPVQARELTGIQSILQDQIEKFGSHIFKDGSSVTGGGVRWNPGYTSVRIQQFNEGLDVDSYLYKLEGEVVIGSESGVKAKIKASVTRSDSYILYISYLNTGGEDNQSFVAGESLLLDNNILTISDDKVFQPGEAVAQTTPTDAVFSGCGAQLSNGIYFIRGYFIEVPEQTISINPYTHIINCKIGLEISETIIGPDLDSSLNDNAAGYSNYTAPGADRLDISAKLVSIPITENKISNFIEMMEIRAGKIASVTNNNPQYNELAEEFARRTYDESGNYYVKPYSITPRNTLNDYEGNNGLFSADQSTYNNNVPSENLGTYKISPGKAYIKGFEVETIVPSFLDFEKPRTTKTLENQSINYVTGPTFTLNRVTGAPQIGIGTDYTVSLRDQRVGAAATTAAGQEIGLARVYDFALESGSYDASNSNINEWDISLYDIQTYTNITLNTAATLSVPTHIKGKSSGATGYLRYEINAGTALTAYNTKGEFITGEQFIFNGVESGNISVGSTAYSTSDIKSIRGTVSTANTFSADVKQTPIVTIGQVNVSSATTSGSSAGIATVTSTDPNKFFSGIATVGNIVEYTNTSISGVNTVSYARITGVSQRSLTLAGVTTVAGICEGGLPTIIAGDSNSGAINPSNFKILTSQFQSSTDNNLYTALPNKNISNVDLTGSSIVIRKEFDVSITNNSTGAVSSGSVDETFLPFDEERYVLIRTGNGVDDFGGTESLSADKINFNTGSTEITINGLGSNSSAKLIATLRKINVKEKIKEIKKINTLTVVGSANSTSGIGTTTLNDGLTFNEVFGTRVQDEEISLNAPDVIKLHGVFESSDSSVPVFPKATLSSINSSTAKTGDLLIGEKFVASTSKFTGIYVSKDTDAVINYIKLNDATLKTGETLTFLESGITATVAALALGSNNITEEFTLDNGQRDTIYDYSRLVRKPEYDAPSKQLNIVFESAYFTSSDGGDVTTASSYDNFDYKNLPKINDDRVSDIIDIRPRVSDFSGTSRSPFEFLGRSFTADGNSAKNILASDESSLLGYSYYLPRYDKIYLSKDGLFELVIGTPSENPEWPNVIDGALEIASVKLPAYLYDINDVSISLATYKRYQMSDIGRLENRIENLEFYTSLSLLEDKTLNMQITDVDGLNRFKSGFFVDDFSDTEHQLKKTIVKNSIDYKNGELRPSPYTTELDLKLDLNSANGVTQTGRVLTLDYDNVEYVNQPFATRVENVTPYLVNYYSGTIDFLPSSDVWVDEVVLTAKNEDLTTYTEDKEQLSASEFDSRTGYGPVTWGGWNENWSGNTGTATRIATKKLVKETFSTINEGPKVVNTQLASHMRSRNIKFDTQRLKPQTSIYAFFDGQDINKYIIPKLLEITMTTGTFAVGETVIGTDSNGKEFIRFKVAQANHKRGPFDAPTTTYKNNPYYQFTPLYKGLAILVDSIVPLQSDAASTDSSPSGEVVVLPESYSSTSSILNIDMTSLADKSDNTYYGYVEKDLKLAGQTSNAQAKVSNLRLRSDNVGSVIGSFFIPDPNETTSPKFDTGKKIFRLTSNKVNSQIPGNVTTDATQVFESTGSLDTVQSTVISVKNIHTDILTRTETKSISRGGGGNGGSTPTYTTTSTSTTILGGLMEGGTTTTTVTNDQTGEIVSETVETTDVMNGVYQSLLGRDKDPGGGVYWTEQIKNETNIDLSDPDSLDDAIAYLEPFFAATTEGKDRAAGNQDDAVVYVVQNAQAGSEYVHHTITYEQENMAAAGGTSGVGVECPAGEDPLGQSFRVEGPTGVYITKADIYIASKDEFLPLVVQLRTVKLGLPTTEIIPFGEIVIDPEDITVSEDASIPTTVTFPSPVYLPGGQTYALVLLSISNDYTAWISRMGETDIQTVDKPEADQIVISSQPTLGSLFKSQNGETWNASQYEDLKFTLYRAQFSTRQGNINFTNPPLLNYSDDIPPLLKDSFRISSNKIRVGFNTTISDTGITLGNIVQQEGSNATGRYVGYAGTATGNLTITNAGVGYTPSSGSETYHHVPMVTQTGSGRNGTMHLTITNGVAVAATVTNGGSGYEIGDVVGVATVGLTSLGRDIQFSIATLTGTNEFVLDQVQGEFATGVGKTMQYVTSAGIVTLNHTAGGNVFLSGSPVTVTDGLHIKVNQKNHGMYSTQNVVTLNDVESDVPATTLSADYDSSSTGSIIVNDGSNFAEFENVGVGSTNLGYVKVGKEILSYSGVNANILTGVTRGVDSTQTLSHDNGDLVHKYELNGISLRRINKDHNLADATVSDPIGLDHYNIKIDTSANGVDRSVGTSLPILHFNETKSTGGSDVLSTENIPFEIITPIVQNMTPPGTNLTAQVRTVTGSSVDGSETPFQDQGFEDISLTTDNFMSSPRIIASRINETTSLTTLPDNKSFTLNLSLEGGDPLLSPIVDLDRIAFIFTSNRVNNPISNYITDNRVNSLKDDPNAFVYASKPVTLESGATGIKIHMEGHINLTSDIRAFYAISEGPNDELVYQPFPGYNNLLSSGQVIDPAKNDGLPDKALPKTDVIAYTPDQVIWKDYEFTIDDLPTFRYFSIKLVGTGTNQAQPPRVKNLRVIALA